jgi:hypothetical protein
MLRLEFLELGVELVCWLRPNDSEVDDDAAVPVDSHALRLAAGGFDSLDCRSHVSLTKIAGATRHGPSSPSPALREEIARQTRLSTVFFSSIRHMGSTLLLA